MSVVEDFSGIDGDDMLQLRKKTLLLCFTYFCICVRSRLAIEICCRQCDLVDDVQVYFQYSDHPLTASMTCLVLLSCSNYH